MIPENFSISKLRQPVLDGETRHGDWRRLQLKRIGKILENNQNEILESLAKDLGKPPVEAFFEVIAVHQELKLAEEQLSRWMKPRRIQVPLSLSPAEAMVTPEPLGCVLIISPWNYPFSLTLQPLISALAAGNTVVIKPSEHAPFTSHLIANLIPKYFPEGIIRVIEGDGNDASILLDQNFDHIFFTGSETIGRKVMEAASKHLTPVTLELGGKSPALVMQGADLEVTARRLIWGKSLNAGQTCIAPNHLIVHKALKSALLSEIEKALSNFYGPDPINSQHLGRIINERHFNRLNQLLTNARDNDQLIFGGKTDEKRLRITPALIDIQTHNDPLMREELFGPIFPVLSVPDFDSALSEVRSQPRPLALYMFGGTTKEKQKLLKTTSSGGVCFNDVIMQAGVPELPFGGVGPSGMGTYHGLAGFETFSHKKSVLKRPFWLDLRLRYPPYKIKVDFLKKLFS